VNLLQYNHRKPPKCFGHLQEGIPVKDILQRKIDQSKNIKF